MVMMMGEIEYNDLYYPDKTFITFTNATHAVEDSDPEINFFPMTAHMVLTIFILIVSIVIMNLLFGMAVSDVQVNINIFEILMGYR